MPANIFQATGKKITIFGLFLKKQVGYCLE
jgi:hypothetical protein